MTSIQDLADQIADQHDIPRRAALRTAETYAAQIREIDGTPESDELTDAQSAFLLESARRALDDQIAASDTRLGELADLRDRITQLDAERAGLVDDRDALIRSLLDDGIPGNQLAEPAGLTRARIYTIRDQA